MRILLVAALLASSLGLAGCTDSGSDVPRLACGFATPDAGNAIVILSTNWGDLGIELYTAKAPITAGNFLNLTRDGFYNGTVFHRAIQDFMIQGGDPTGTGRGGPGYTIKDEFHPDLKHDRKGRLSMANSGPNTGGSQFFVTAGPTSWLDGRHAIFGQVVGGMEVFDRINAEAARPSSDGSNGVPPLKPIDLESARAC